MRPRHLDIVAIVFLASPLLCPCTAYGQTASQTPSSADTLGVACAPNGALSYNGNSFVACTSGVWAIDPVSIGTASSAPATCNAAAEGMLYFDTGSTAVKVCTGSSWTAVGSGGSASAAGSTGDVQFNSGGSLAANANFFWDNTNGRLGIGTAAPTTALNVGGGTAATTLYVYGNVSGSENSWARMIDQSGTSIGFGAAVGGTQTLHLEGGSGASYFNGGGGVGIGVTGPAEPLDVETTSTNISVKVGNAQGAMTLSGGDGSNAYINVPSWGLGLQTGGTTRLLIASGGNVAIGNTSPQNTLDVNGGISSYGGGASSRAAPAVSMFYNTSAGYGEITSLYQGSTWEPLAFQSNGAEWFNASSTQTMTLTNGGSLGIGSTSPQAALDIQGQLSFSGNSGQSGSVNRIATSSNTGWMTLNSPTAIYLNNLSGANNYLNGGGTTYTGTIVGGTIEVNNVEQAYGNYIWPGRNDGSGGNYQTSWYLASNSSWGLYTNTSMYFAGGIYQGAGAYVYPGCNSCGGNQTSYFWYDDNGDSGLHTNGNLLADGNIYLGSWGNWLTSILSQYMTGANQYSSNYAYNGCYPGSISGNGLFTSGQTVYLDWWSVANCATTVANSIISDARLKTDIKPLADDAGLSAVMKLKPVTFEWKDAKRAAKEGEQIGFIAQDMEKAYPLLVLSAAPSMTITKADGSKETIKDVKSIKYQNLTAPLVKAVQELKIGDDARDQTLAALRARLEQDEREIAQLKHQMRAQ